VPFRNARTGLRPLLAAILLLTSAAPVFAADLPKGFVRLADVDPGIRQDIRYAGSDNFLGRPVKGYDAPSCILTRAAAEALSGVQKTLAADGLTLVVYDCYRPARAVADMVAWTMRGGAPDGRWYPKVRRDSLVALGYVASQSAHSRGSTVDVAVAPLDGKGGGAPACGAAQAGTLDFGTGFDCFDAASQTHSDLVSALAARNRATLLDAMRAAGFANYAREWWHFTLRDEPFPKKHFDFPVSAP
jgi:D-alanyl-D-alanine dipeptidase